MAETNIDEIISKLEKIDSKLDKLKELGHGKK
jgi:hypothetical protein